MNYKTTAWLQGPAIIVEEGWEDERHHLCRHIIDTKDELIKEKLVQLGWTPPGVEVRELVDRAHVTRLQAELIESNQRQAKLQDMVDAAEHVQDHLSKQIDIERIGRDALKAENESFRKSYVTKLAYNALQSELTKARELVKNIEIIAMDNGAMVYSDAPGFISDIRELLARQSAPASKE